MSRWIRARAPTARGHEPALQTLTIKARRLARELALDVLYEAEIRDILPLECLELRRDDGWVTGGGEEMDEPGPIVHVPEHPAPEALAYARRLVEGVQSHQADIDVLIAHHADRWAIKRMPVVDRSLLRMGLYELLWEDDVPVAVAINEAVEMAKALSTEDSGRFVNGLLGRVAEESSP